MKITTIFLLIILWAPAGHTESWSAKIVDYGIYSVSTEGKSTDESVAGGLVSTTGKRLIEETTQLEAKIGTSFGFRYLLSGPDYGADVQIKVIHPSPITDPNTGKVFSRSEWGQWVPTDSVNWNTGWLFENDWEIVEGKWSIQLYLDDTKLLEQEFQISDGVNTK